MKRRAFTLIELLVVLAIIAVLLAMLMPVVGLVRDAARRSNTQAIMSRVDAALRMFRTDFGVYPNQQSYPDVSAGAPFPNRLAYHLGSDISWAVDPLSGYSAATAVQADMDAAAAKYAYNASETGQPSPLTFRKAYVTSQGDTSRVATVLNRMAQEQARLAVLAGNLTMRGQIITGNDGAVVRDQRTTPVFAVGETLRSATRPGWAKDYLQGQLESRYLKGDAVCDVWGRPLIYICSCVPGIKGAYCANNGGGINWFRSWQYGLGALGFDPTTGPGPALVAAGRPLLIYGGRVRLSATDAGDGEPTPGDATWFPDVGDPMSSDVRYYAAPEFEREFELWSAGRDGCFSYRRGDAVNRDNIPAGPYLKGLGRGE